MENMCLWPMSTIVIAHTICLIKNWAYKQRMHCVYIGNKEREKMNGVSKRGKWIVCVKYVK